MLAGCDWQQQDQVATRMLGIDSYTTYASRNVVQVLMYSSEQSVKRDHANVTK